MLVDGIMPDESTLPVPKQVKIGRPKGRKNKVNELGCEDPVDQIESGRAKKRKRASGIAIGLDSESQHSIEGSTQRMKDSSVKRVDQAISREVSLNTRPDMADEAQRTLNIVALPSHEDSLIDPEIDIVDHTGEKAHAGQTCGSPVMEMVDLQMMDDTGDQNSHSVNVSTYPAEWSSDAVNDIKILPEQETESSVDRSDARSDLQDYLMRFSNVVD
jgi:hypothetical protein